jgi:hypothetical protein
MLAQRLKLTALALGGSHVALVIAMVFLGKQAQLRDLPGNKFVRGEGEPPPRARIHCN